MWFIDVHTFLKASLKKVNGRVRSGEYDGGKIIQNENSNTGDIFPFKYEKKLYNINI